MSWEQPSKGSQSSEFVSYELGTECRAGAKVGAEKLRNWHSRGSEGPGLLQRPRGCQGSALRRALSVLISARLAEISGSSFRGRGAGTASAQAPALRARTLGHLGLQAFSRAGPLRQGWGTAAPSPTRYTSSSFWAILPPA